MFAEDGFGSGFGGAGRKKRADEGPARLNITAMMDMFTIMLIFLLLNFAPDQADLKMATDMTLPPSTSTRPYEVAVKVALTRSELLVGDDVVAKVRRGRFVDTEMDGDIILPLQRVLLLERAKVESSDNAVVLFYADQDSEYSLIEKVTASAASAGFANFKFAVNGT